ncbi:MAG: hypothetical protein KIT27_03445 [Legionellales bacterium]|nr:hypothetical protein [Legionellales bacterium]
MGNETSRAAQNERLSRRYSPFTWLRRFLDVLLRPKKILSNIDTELKDLISGVSLETKLSELCRLHNILLESKTILLKQNQHNDVLTSYEGELFRIFQEIEATRHGTKRNQPNHALQSWTDTFNNQFAELAHSLKNTIKRNTGFFAWFIKGSAQRAELARLKLDIFSNLKSKLIEDSAQQMELVQSKSDPIGNKKKLRKSSSSVIDFKPEALKKIDGENDRNQNNIQQNFSIDSPPVFFNPGFFSRTSSEIQNSKSSHHSQLQSVAISCRNNSRLPAG